jgi:hypothetical protein
MYLIFPIKSIKFFKNIITSKNEILCAEAGIIVSLPKEVNIFGLHSRYLCK